MFDRLFRFIIAAQKRLPHRCLLCLQPSRRSVPLCAGCERDLPWLQHPCSRCALPLSDRTATCGRCLQHPPPWSRCIAALEYRQPTSQLINRFKERGDLAAGRVLGQLLASRVNPGHIDLLLPVPLHWRRRLRRGFNQSDELALQLGRQLGIAVGLRHLRKRAATPAQHQLSKRDRQHNLRDLFVVKKSLRGLRVALIDDVMTTGSTARALTQTLLKAGARDVQIWCVARTPEKG